MSGISGWREQVMAFWRALIYTPPFLSLSSVKRWERWGAASSHSCELHLPGVRGSIVNSDLVPSTMPNYYQHHVIYTSVAGENIALQAVTGQSCAAAERGALHIHDEHWFTVDLVNLLLSFCAVKTRSFSLEPINNQLVPTSNEGFFFFSFELKSFLQLQQYVGNNLYQC